MTGTGYCKCFDGYYGSECQYECPGGATNPCYGNGACNTATGTCACYDGAEPGTDCSPCEEGRFGTDCSMVHTTNNNMVDGKYQGKVFHSGHFVTFDGSVYNNHIPGEQTLMSTQLSSGSAVKVNILQVPNSEYYNTVGTQSVGVQVGDHTAVVSVLDGKVTAYLDGESVVVGNGVVIDDNVKIVQISESHYQVKADNDVTVDIFPFEDHIDVSVAADPSLCDDSAGMMSSCNGNYADDFKTNTGEILTGDSLNTQSIHEDFASSYTSSGTSMFSSILPVSNAGGYGLSTNRSNMVTETLQSFTEVESTIELKFKQEESSTGCQTVWSYKVVKDVFSTLVCDGKISIHMNGEILEFNSLLVEEDTWYNMALVWNNDTRLLSAYLIRDDLQMSSEILLIPDDEPNPIKPGGTMMMGQWNYPEDDRTGVNWNFIGEFDDLRVWKDDRTVNELRSNSFSVLSGTEADLSNNWNFNSGKGSTLTDSVGGLGISMSDTPWRKPDRTLVNYVAQTPDTSVYDVFSHPETTDPELAKFCNETIFSQKFNDACSSVGPQVQAYFYKDCVFNGIITKDRDSTMEVILALSDQCGISRDSDTWPTKDLCNSFATRPFPGWTGESCSMKCESGTVVGNKCVCNDRYWGTSCENVCPFSRGLPCRGGTCSTVDGTCKCLVNFDGANCGNCGSGWHGVDCGVALATIPMSTSLYTCSLFGQAHFTMFDGQSYQLGTTGEFVFLKNTDMSVFIRQVPCGENQAVCLKQVWVQADSQDFTVVSPLAADGKTKFYLNGESVDLGSAITFTSNIEIKQSSPITISVTSGENVITIRHEKALLELYAAYKTSVCSSNIEGLCGSCDRNVNNDFILTDSVVTLSDISKDVINGDFGNNWKIDSQTSTAFEYTQDGIEEPRVPNGGSFVLAYNGSGSSSSQLNGIFGENGNTTLQVKFKPKANEGIIMGYSKDSSVSVYLDGSVHVLWGDQDIDIGYTPELDNWYTVSMVYSNETNKLKVYVNDDDDIQTLKEVTVQSNALESGGILKMGSWTDSGAPKEFKPFIGEIGEFKTWNKTLDMYEILYTSTNRVSDEFNELKSSWVFSEGGGRTAVDLVGGSRITLPDEGVVWIQSDMTMDGKVPEAPINETLKEEASTICQSLLSNTHLSQTCAGLGDGINNFYYESCVDDIMFKSDKQAFTNSIFSFAEYCVTTIDPPEHPLKDLCTDKTSSFYTEICIYQCNFGKIDNDECVCFDGYWGDVCDKDCDGGTVDPCNSKGYCRQDTGVCYCYQTFDSSTNCATCLDEWTGPNCDMIVPIIPNSTTQSTSTTQHTTTSTGGVNTTSDTNGTDTTDTPTIDVTDVTGVITSTAIPLPPTTPTKPAVAYTASVFGQGNVKTFNDGFFSFKEPGEFSLMKSDDGTNQPNVQLRNTYCYNDKSVCPTGVAVEYGNSRVVIRSSYTEGQKDVIIVNGKRYDFGEETEVNIGDLFIKHTSDSEYTITPNSGEYFEVHVRSSDEQLNVQVTAWSSLCETQDSLIGSCDPADTTIVIDKEKFKVKESDSTFNELYANNDFGETRNVSTAGSSVVFNNSVIKTGFLENVISKDQDFAVDFLFKPEDNDGGVLMIYDTNSEFTTYIDGTVKHKIGDTIYDTGIEAKPGEWHDITISYQSAPSELTTYVSRPDGTTEQKTFPFVDNKAFENNGYIGLGHPVNPPATADNPEPYEKYYVGEMDEFKIFDKAFDIKDVEEMKMKPVNTDNSDETDNLVTYWKFDDPRLTTIKDEMNNTNVTVADYGVLHQPLKSMFSTVPFDQPTIPAFHSFPDFTDQMEAVDKCNSLISTSALGTQSGPSDGMKDFYMATCISDAAGANSMDAALPVITSMADLSVESGWSDSWPAQTLCNEFNSPFPGYVGSDCSIPCDYPSSMATSSCICDTAHWGTSCSNICPGGPMNPCNKHGLCDTVAGTCTCQSNWAAPNCTTCMQGWYGEDCSISVQPKLPGQSQYFGGISGNGHATTLDGAAFTFENHGIFSAYKNPSTNLDIQVQTGPTQNFDTAVTGVAFKTSQDVVSFSPVNDGTMYINGEESTTGTTVSLSDGYSITPLDSDVYKLQHSSNGFEMTVTALDDYINVEMSGPSSTCSGSVGLFGSCTTKSHSCGPTDYQCQIEKEGLAHSSTTSTLPTHAIDSYLGSFNQPFDSSIFKESNPEMTTSVGVFLNDSWISTKPLEERFVGTDMTVEMMMNIHELDANMDGGTVMSYSYEQTMGVTIDNGHFNVQVDNISYPTDIEVKTDQWTSLAMSYNNDTGDVRLNYVYDGGMMDSAIVNIGQDMMPIRGSLVAGQWQEPLEGGGFPPPDGAFIGDIDRMLLWNKLLSPTEVMLHAQTPILGPQDGLTMGWNFPTGEGPIIPDFVRDQEMSMSPTGASWTPTNPPYMRMDEPSTEMEFSQFGDIDAIVKEVCEKLFEGDDDGCGDLAEAQTFYKMACQDDVKVADNPDFSMDSMMAFGAACEAIKNPPEPPMQDMCNSFPSREYPVWNGDSCNKQCIMGTYNPVTDACDCFHGFWGEMCMEECVGRSTNPCNGHGDCNVADGSCSCYGNWQGDFACSTCTNGYSGPNCEFRTPNIPVDSPMVCLAEMKGEYTNFTGYGMLTYKTGTYVLYHTNNFHLEVGHVYIFCNICTFYNTL